MFQKRHYECLARELRQKYHVEPEYTEMSAVERSVNIRSRNERDIILSFLVKVFSQDNVNFDAMRFTDAACSEDK